MGRRNFLVTLAYDGSEFSGWQRGPQGRPRTVQAAVEEALASVLGEAVEITGASRTDAGVHAEGQAASFHSRSPASPEEILGSLNRKLPGDCACTSCREVDPRFHARFRAKGKLYRYRLQTGPVPDPFARRWSLRVAEPLDQGAMAAAAACFQGRHDFRAFSNAKGEGDGVRSLDSVSLVPGPGRLDLLFKGEGFLYNQVRLMASALVEVGRGRLAPRAIEEALAGGKGASRPSMPGTLGAYGLCLVQVFY